MYKTKGFGYDTVKDKDVMDHIAKQGNGSLYIWTLVRKDMKDGDIQDLIKKEVDNYMEEIARGVKGYR